MKFKDSETCQKLQSLGRREEQYWVLGGFVAIYGLTIRFYFDIRVFYLQNLTPFIEQGGISNEQQWRRDNGEVGLAHWKGENLTAE